MAKKKDAATTEQDEKAKLHTEFRNQFDRYFRFCNGDTPAPWDGREAGALKRWMQSNPTITLEQWRILLYNRYKSPVNHALNLSAWISKALTWLNFITDERERPIHRGKNAKQSLGVPASGTAGFRDRAATNREAVAIALEQAEADSASGSDGDVTRSSSVARSADGLLGSVIEGKF